MRKHTNYYTVVLLWLQHAHVNMGGLEKESLETDGQQFYQYQKKIYL